MVLGWLFGRTLRSIDFDYMEIRIDCLFHLDGRKVRGGLYQSGHLMAHGNHAVRAFAECHDEAVRLVCGDERLRHVGCLQLELHLFLHLAEHTFHLGYVVVPLDADLLFVSHRDGDDRLRLAGYRVAQVTAVDGCQLDLRLRPYTGEEPYQKLVGVRAALVDIVARVTTHESAYREADTQLCIVHCEL